MFYCTVALLLYCSAAQSYAAPAEVWETGQTKCYQGVSPYAEIACAGTRQDGDKKAGVAWPIPRFTDNGNGTVTDNLTGLIWLKNANCFSWKTWQAALDSSNALASSQCGLSDGSQAGDWRLPNRKELLSLVDYSKFYPALPASHPFTNAQSYYYWSSSTNAYYTYVAWHVYMGDGYVSNFYKTHSLYVWPVRGGQSGSLGNFTITDPNGNAITDKAVNEQFQIKATARNGDGTVKTGWSGTVYISANGLSKSYILITSGGTATATVSINTPGTGVQINAMGGGMSGISNAFNVTGTACYGSIYGKVKQDINLLTGATVALTSSSYSPPPATSSNGGYSFTNVPAGSYELYATYYGGESSRIQLTVGCGVCISKDINVYQQCNPNGKTPVLLVPGIAGSTTDGTSLIPTLPPACLQWNDPNLIIYDNWLETAKGWENLRAILGNKGYIPGCTLFDVPYDWRKDNDTVAEEYLKKWIDEAKAKSGSAKVNIIAHSQGGLVTRAYIQGSQYPNRNDIDRFAMIATPNHGSAKAYYLWEGADPGTLDETVGGSTYEWLVNKLVFGSIIHLDFPWSSRLKMYDYIRNNVLSMKQLMPTYSFLNPLGNTQCGTNSWLNSLNSGNISRLTTETDTDPNKVRTKLFYSNSSNSTIGTINAQTKDCSRKFYPDGEPLRYAGFTYAGDTTVLGSSADLPEANITVDSSMAGEHSKLVNTYASCAAKFINSEQIGTTCAALAGAALAQQATSATSTLSLAVTGRAQPLLISPAGQRSGIDNGVAVSNIPGTTQSIGVDAASIGIESPADGTYTISMSGVQAEDYSLTIEYVSAAGESAFLSAQGFNHANTTSFTFTLNSAATQKLTMNQTPLPPTNLQADAYNSGGLKTGLSWNASTGAASYLIYAKNSDEPYLAQIGTTTGLSLNTGDAWAADSSVTTRVYAVSAVNGSGTESFLSNTAENNDRDHDGLADAQEAALGTNPDNPDSDGDGLKDGEEYIKGTNPLLTDTDGDGYSDKEEIVAGSDPLDNASLPAFSSDVPSGYWAYDYIYSIYAAGITVGCSQNPLMYCPDADVTRGQMAAFIIRAKYGETFTYTQTPYFSDVPATNAFFKYVQRLKDDAITALTGTYYVDASVTRGQMAAFIIRAKYGETFTYTSTPYFSDVPDTNVFFKYVQRLKDDNITALTGTYYVDAVVTRGQMAAFIARAFLGMP